MEENQSREQYWFEDETFEWLGDLISRTERVGAVFTPSLLKYPNVWVFDADERFEGTERYTMGDVTRSVPDLDQFGMIISTRRSCSVPEILRPCPNLPGPDRY